MYNFATLIKLNETTSQLNVNCGIMETKTSFSHFNIFLPILVCASWPVFCIILAATKFKNFRLKLFSFLISLIYWPMFTFFEKLFPIKHSCVTEKIFKSSKRLDNHYIAAGLLKHFNLSSCAILCLFDHIVTDLIFDILKQSPDGSTFFCFGFWNYTWRHVCQSWSKIK